MISKVKLAEQVLKNNQRCVNYVAKWADKGHKYPMIDYTNAKVIHDATLVLPLFVIAAQSVDIESLLPEKNRNGKTSLGERLVAFFTLQGKLVMPKINDIQVFHRSVHLVDAESYYENMKKALTL